MREPIRCRRRPVVLTAIRWTGYNLDSVERFAPGQVMGPGEFGVLTVETPEGAVWARPGDWLIKGVEGEVYPCSASVFEKVYDVVEGP